MYKFAVINGGVVINSILADSKELAEELSGHQCVHSLEAGIGWTYNAETNEFTAPELETAEEIIEEPLAIDAPTEPVPTE